MPKLIQVIESDTSRGSGTENDPYRTVCQIHSLDGELLAERDAWLSMKMDDWMTDAATFRTIVKNLGRLCDSLGLSFDENSLYSFAKSGAVALAESLKDDDTEKPRQTSSEMLAGAAEAS